MSHVKVPRNVMDAVKEKRINYRQLWVWMLIRSHDWTHEGKGYGCTAAHSTLAEEGGMARETITRDIKKLIEEGLIMPVQPLEDQKSKRYICVVEDGDTCDQTITGDVTISSQVRDQMITGHVTISSHEVDKRELDKRNRLNVSNYARTQNFTPYDWVNKKDPEKEQYNPIQWMLERWS